jgi:hypothetical protein
MSEGGIQAVHFSDFRDGNGLEWLVWEPEGNILAIAQ